MLKSPLPVRSSALALGALTWPALELVCVLPWCRPPAAAGNAAAAAAEPAVTAAAAAALVVLPAEVGWAAGLGGSDTGLACSLVQQ